MYTRVKIYAYTSRRVEAAECSPTGSIRDINDTAINTVQVITSPITESIGAIDASVTEIGGGESSNRRLRGLMKPL